MFSFFIICQALRASFPSFSLLAHKEYRFDLLFVDICVSCRIFRHFQQFNLVDFIFFLPTINFHEIFISKIVKMNIYKIDFLWYNFTCSDGDGPIHRASYILHGSPKGAEYQAYDINTRHAVIPCFLILFNFIYIYFKKTLEFFKFIWYN